MKHKATWIAMLLLAALAALCSGCQTKQETPLPETIRNQTFLYDELETGEGDALYTLRFTDSGYYLNQDNGVGVLAHGDMTAADDRSLTAADGGVTQASYTGSAFEEPAATLTWQGRQMRFTPASETAEYVYLSYLGTFSGQVDGQDAVLILERWFEWYLYTGDKLTRGTYEVFSDGSIQLTTLEGKSYTGTVQRGEGSFDLRNVTLELKLGKKQASFSYCEPSEQYDAAHAMGTYTLSLYPCSVFEIHGVDGFLKAFGTLKDGTVTYFPRQITGDAESDYQFSVSSDGDICTFPDSTPLLPRSGNIRKETGLGRYWNAGTTLEFIRRSGGQALASARELFPEADTTGSSNLPKGLGGLEQVMPSVGTAKPLVLLIDFPDQHRPRYVTAEGIERALFSLDEADSLSAFYYRSSYGRLTIDATVLGWYRTQQEHGAYESDTEIMREAIDYYIKNEGLQLADHDADGDGVVDSLYILWAGNMDSSSGMWNSAYRSTWENSPEEWDRRITGYIFVPGTTIWSSVPPLRCNTNSLIHETGHLLGLNDYYSYDTSSRSSGRGAYTGGALEGGVAGMDMMDTNTGDHNVFSKWLLGWAEPEVIEYEQLSDLNGQTYRLRPSALSGDGLFIKLRSADSLYTELLVVEAVSPVLNFAEYTRLKSPVVRVLHVDATPAQAGMSGGWRGFGWEYDNSYTSTKFISVVEADGQDSALNYVPTQNGGKFSYDPADYFTAGASLTPDTYPNTNGYDAYGNATVATGLCIYVDSIEADGTAVIRLSYQQPGQRLTLEDVSPQPAAVPYPTGEMQTVPTGTSQLRFTFSHDLAWAGTDSAGRIRVYADQEELSGVTAQLEGSTLVVSLPQGMEADRSCTVVLPAGILTAAEDTALQNSYNSIFGFITSP